MKKKYLGLILGVMLMAAGCASGSNQPEPSAEATEASAAESKEESTTAADEAKDDKEAESLEAARESLQAAEESLKAMEESLQEMGESLKAEEESVQATKDTDYDKLVKDPETYQKKKVKFTGEIIRSAAVGSTAVQIVLAVDGDKEDRVVGEYKKSIVDGTLSTGDKITLSGEFQGLIRYRMQTGGAETLPTVNIDKIENIVRKEPETVAAPQPTAGAPATGTGIPNFNGTETAPVADAPTMAESTAAAEDGEIMDAEPAAETSPVIAAGQGTENE